MSDTDPPDPRFSGDDWLEKYREIASVGDGEAFTIPYDAEWWRRWQEKTKDVPLW